jgi:GNAT superfamily N-acetyltransferase
MKRTTSVRAMRTDDLPSVLRIQSCCYDEAKLESQQAFLAKLEASPVTCFMALVDGAAAGYLVAVPAELGRPPPLNSPTFLVPARANALYLHDLAVHPDARGAGVAVALIEAFFGATRRSRLPFACLTAVNDSRAFWERHGFRAAAIDADAASMATYGEGACYMGVRVEPRA